MKRKSKDKSKTISKQKHLKKELASQLSLAFNNIVSQFGKAKKTEKLIEKFARQLSKKVNILTASDSIEAFIKEDEVLIVSKPAAVKRATKKAKEPTQEEITN